jgi:hypothetical protein
MDVLFQRRENNPFYPAFKVTRKNHVECTLLFIPLTQSFLRILLRKRRSFNLDGPRGALNICLDKTMSDLSTAMPPKMLQSERLHINIALGMLQHMLTGIVDIVSSCKFG